MQELNRIDVQQYKRAEKMPVVLVLDNIRSLNNIGSAFRTADAFRIEKIYLCGITAKPPHREIHKTALGATESVDWGYTKNTKEALEKLHKDDYYVYAIEQCKNSTLLNDAVFQEKKKIAFVFGNEVEGVDQIIVDICDSVLEIPQFGTKHSINISVSIGIVLWDVFKKTKAFIDKG